MIVTIGMQKGGTAKSTTTAALAQAAAAAGKRALVIDLDPQGNTSFFLSADATRPGAYELLTGTAPAQLIQGTRQGVDVIPASWNLATVTSSRGSARRLQAAVEPIKGSYDIILIDTPPNAGELQYNALTAADALIIPLQADIVGLQGLYLMHDTAQEIHDTSNPALQIAGIVLTRHNPRSIITRQMQAKITATAQDMGVPFLGVVREGVAVKEAQALQVSLFDYAPRSKPAADYKTILDKIGV